MSARLLRLSSFEGSAPGMTGGTNAKALRLAIVSNPDDFAALRGSWNALAASSQAGVFLQHEWFDAAWQWRQHAARLFLLSLYRGSRLVGLLPLVREESATGGSGVRELSFLTVPDTQACDIIVAEDERGVAAEVFAEELVRRRDEWDVLRLRYLAPGTVAASSFRDALARKRLTTRLEQGGGNPYVCLDSPWEAYYATRSRSLKKANNLAANRLGKAGEVKIEWLEPGAGDAGRVAQAVEQIIGISSRSWKQRTGNSLDNPGPQEFIRRLSHLAHERRWLSVWTLTLDGRPLAMEYQLVANGRVFALRSDFDEAFEEISPGSHLSRHLLQQLFGRGLERYSMGPGENPYKHRWAEQVEPVAELSVYGRSLRGRWLAVWETVLKPAVRKARDRFVEQASRERTRDDA